MRVRFLLGPAGSGKTFRCLAEVRRLLLADPEGAPLAMVAPKQATYQLERQLLADPALSGYTRLQILSFERLARSVNDRLGRSAPKMLDEQGRVMILRGILARKRDELKLFRASARLAGFAQQLSNVLAEFQRRELTPGKLREAASRFRPTNEGLAFKLEDFAVILEEYSAWLSGHGLKDAESLVGDVTQALLGGDSTRPPGHPEAQVAAVDQKASSPVFEEVWVDGFVDFSAQELAFLAALVRRCEHCTVTFPLEPSRSPKLTWLSPWSPAQRSFEQAQAVLGNVPGITLSTERVERVQEQGRFARSPVLRHLERSWAAPGTTTFSAPDLPVKDSLRIVACPTPEYEAAIAAREILRHVRSGGRYRDAAVLVRSLEHYHQPIARAFARYEIPFFLDRREVVSHHPLAELTRGALRTVVFQWRREDWFAVLKTGLVPASDDEIDRLENEALARGWEGPMWQKPIVVGDDAALRDWLADIHHRVLPPFNRLALAMEQCDRKPTGPELAAMLRALWDDLGVEGTLEQWAEGDDALEEEDQPGAVHATVWDQLNGWLNNVELGFPRERLTLREWLPVIEAGLGGLTVGVIPPALDQVIVSTVDRSRNPEQELTLLLGLNESVFPAPPERGSLLTDEDRVELERGEVVSNWSARHHLARERFYAYVALTRATRRLVVSYAQQDSDGALLNPSPFIAQLRQLFPKVEIENSGSALDWRDAEHCIELVVPWLKARATHVDPSTPFVGLDSLLLRLQQCMAPSPTERLTPETAARLYGNVLGTSVSRIEQFAACPFRFFVNSGLKVEERKRFELDVKEQGTFQHEALALFHESLRAEGRKWRDLTPQEARQRMHDIAETLSATYRQGLLHATEQSRFTARVMLASLQDFVETVVDWMRGQYRFDPVQVELAFGETPDSPACVIEVGNGRKLQLYGRIDRVDLYRDATSGLRYCVVIDYKSSRKELNPVLVHNGVQLQLLAYLNVLRKWRNASSLFGTEELIPAGVFYVNIRGNYQGQANRADALLDTAAARKLAYQHRGRFDARVLKWLDARANAEQGDQFNYRLKKDGTLRANCQDPLTGDTFEALLEGVETSLKRMGQEVFAGNTLLSPYRHGAETACDDCSYLAICRLDPWTQSFRALRKPPPKPVP